MAGATWTRFGRVHVASKLRPSRARHCVPSLHPSLNPLSIPHPSFPPSAIFYSPPIRAPRDHP
eukprot:2791394-Pyramimonas_sp.AAC.1